MIFIGGELGSVAKSPLAKGDWWRKILWWKCSGGERVRWRKGIGGERVRWRKSWWRMGLWWKGLWRIAPWRKLQHQHSIKQFWDIRAIKSTLTQLARSSWGDTVHKVYIEDAAFISKVQLKTQLPKSTPEDAAFIGKVQLKRHSSQSLRWGRSFH